jgi:hypothetical protein
MGAKDQFRDRPDSRKRHYGTWVGILEIHEFRKRRDLTPATPEEHVMHTLSSYT